MHPRRLRRALHADTGTLGRDEALAPEALNGLPVVVSALWAVCGTGWLAVLVALRRSMHGPVRGPVVFGHVAAPAAGVRLFSVLGSGALCAPSALAAEWWALLLVTGFRPERLLSTGGLGRLAAWATLAGAATLVTTRFVFQI